MPTQNLTCTASFEKISQCSTYDVFAHPQVFIPCVKVNNTVYQAGMNLISNAPSLRFEVDLNTLQPTNLIPNEQCAVFPAPNTLDHLRINCLNLGTDKYWVDMRLLSSNAIQFDVVNFGKN